MPLYKVTKVMRYTETLEIEAEDVYSAIQECYTRDGESNNDDSLQDVRVTMISE